MSGGGGEGQKMYANLIGCLCPSGRLYVVLALIQITECKLCEVRGFVFMLVLQPQCLGLYLTHTRDSANICSFNSFLNIITAGEVLQQPPWDGRCCLSSLVSDANS